MGLLFNFSKEKNPAYDRGMKGFNDKINSLLKDIPTQPSFDMGGILGSPTQPSFVSHFGTPFYGRYNESGKIVPYQEGGTISKNPKFINNEELIQYIKNIHSSNPNNAGGTLVGAPYVDGGTIESVIPSTLLSKFNQIGNIVRPNSVQINPSRQAIINRKNLN